MVGDDRRTICHVVSSPIRGGPRAMVYELVKCMDRTRYRPAVAFIRHEHHSAAEGHSESMLADFEALGVPVCVAGMERKWQAGGAVRLDRFFREIGVDLIVSHLWRADMWAGILSWWGRARYVRVHHGTFRVWSARPPDVRYAYRMLERVLHEKADRLVCVSREIMALLERHEQADPRKLVWIPGGVHVEDFRADPPFPLGRPPVVGMLSRLVSYKGVDDFVDAAVMVHAERPDVRFVVAGVGPDGDAMRERAGRAGAGVEFLGRVPDAAAFLAGIDVFVQPSWREGTPASVIEAMAAGRVTVVTDVSGMPDVVEDGVSGVVVPAQDPAALAGALVDLLDGRDRAANLAANGVVRSHEFSVERLCERWDALYRDVLG